MAKSKGGTATTEKNPDVQTDGNGQTQTQNYIPGTEPPRIEELDKLAMEYRAKRDERMALSEEESKLQTRLLELMHKHQLAKYPIPDTDLQVVVEPTDEKAKVKKRDSKKA